MPMTTMNQLFDSTMFFGGNAPFVEELYENYLNDPTSVPAETAFLLCSDNQHL